MDVDISIRIMLMEYEKQGCATIARLVTKFRGYRRAKNCMPPTK